MMDFSAANIAVQMHNDAANTAMQMHNDAMNMHNQIYQQTLLNQQINDTFTRTTQSPVRMGIIPPKDWKPDPYAGLGTELTPQEKLKKKWEDLKKPMYAVQPQNTEVQEAPKKKTFKEKVQDFGHKIKDFFRTLPQKIMCKSQKD